MPVTKTNKKAKKLSSKELEAYLAEGVEVWERIDIHGNFNDFTPEERLSELNAYGEEAQWRAAGIDAYRACIWRTSCGVFTVEEAIPWNRAGFGPIEAGLLADGEYETPEEAIAGGEVPEDCTRP